MREPLEIQRSIGVSKLDKSEPLVLPIAHFDATQPRNTRDHWQLNWYNAQPFAYEAIFE